MQARNRAPATKPERGLTFLFFPLSLLFVPTSPEEKKTQTPRPTLLSFAFCPRAARTRAFLSLYLVTTGHNYASTSGTSRRPSVAPCRGRIKILPPSERGSPPERGSLAMQARERESHRRRGPRYFYSRQRRASRSRVPLSYENNPVIKFLLRGPRLRANVALCLSTPLLSRFSAPIRHKDPFVRFHACVISRRFEANGAKRMRFFRWIAFDRVFAEEYQRS